MNPPRTMVYQVFVDRFAGPAGAPLSPLPADAEPWTAHAGGTLDGIVSRLDHIEALGADLLYLTPVFPAPSNHKYDGTSFDRIEPRFGGEKAFDELAAACRARGMGLVLDGVFNHVGEGHAWFRSAKESPEAPTASWFKWTRWPDDYQAWRGMGWLPELDLARPAVREALFDGPASVLARWIARGATGWRLDCANDLGLEVCAAIAAAGRRGGAEDGIVGEVMAWADAWIEEGRLDAVMNYWFRSTVLGLCAGEVPAVQASANLERMAARWRPEALLRSWNVLSSHDTPRLATLLPDARRRGLARLLAFTLPGVPFVYYGEEVGMEGGPDPDNRRPMPWEASAWDGEALAQVRALARIRREQRALREGAFVSFPHPGTPDLLAFGRTTARPDETVVVVANASGREVQARVFTPLPFLLDALPMTDRTGTIAPVRVEAGSIAVTLPAWSAAVLVPQDGTIPGYRFFRA